MPGKWARVAMAAGSLILGAAGSAWSGPSTLYGEEGWYYPSSHRLYGWYGSVYYRPRGRNLYDAYRLEERSRQLLLGLNRSYDRGILPPSYPALRAYERVLERYERSRPRGYYYPYGPRARLYR